MKRKTNLYTKDYQGKNINPQMECGPFKGHISGDLLDANAIVALVELMIAKVVNGATSEGDTLKELEDKISQLQNSIPTKVSDLTNDSGFITLNDIPTEEVSEDNTEEEPPL